MRPGRLNKKEKREGQLLKNTNSNHQHYQMSSTNLIQQHNVTIAPKSVKSKTKSITLSSWWWFVLMVGIVIFATGIILPFTLSVPHVLTIGLITVGAIMIVCAMSQLIIAHHTKKALGLPSKLTTEHNQDNLNLKQLNNKDFTQVITNNAAAPDDQKEAYKI